MIEIAGDLCKIDSKISKMIISMSFYFGCYTAIQKGYLQTFQKLIQCFNKVTSQTDVNDPKISKWIKIRENELQKLNQLSSKITENKLHGPGSFFLFPSRTGRPHIGRTLPFPGEKKPVSYNEHLMWMECTAFAPNGDPILYLLP